MVGGVEFVVCKVKFTSNPTTVEVGFELWLTWGCENILTLK